MGGGLALWRGSLDAGGAGGGGAGGGSGGGGGGITSLRSARRCVSLRRVWVLGVGTLRLTAITSDDVAKMPYDQQRLCVAKPTGGHYQVPRWRREAVPPPPDYSTPQAVTARCREAGGWRWDPAKGNASDSHAYVQNTWLRASWATEKDTTVARAYRAFIKACGEWRDATPAAPHLPGVGR